MTIETPPDIEELPPNPSRMTSDEDQFVINMDNWFAAQPTYRLQLIAMGEYVHDTAVTVEGLAGNAQQSATAAANQVQLAAEQVQLAAGEVENAQAVAGSVASQANFVGLWSSQSGAATPPLSVYHQGQYWQLLTTLADTSSVEPGTNANVWIPMVETAVDIGQVVYSFTDLSATGLFIESGMSYLQSQYPELFEVLGIGKTVPNVDVTDISGWAPIYPRDAAWSPEGDYLAIGSTTGVALFQRSGDALTQRFNTTDGTHRYVALSPNGEYWAIGSSSGIVLYKKDGSSWTSISAPNTPSSVLSVAFDQTGQYLAVVCESSSNRVTVCKRDGDTFNVIDNNTWDSMPTGKVRCIDFGGLAGEFLVVGMDYIGGAIVYENVNDTFSLLQTVVHGAGVNSVTLSRSGEYLAVATSDDIVEPRIYRKVGATYYLISPNTATPAGNSLDHVEISPDGSTVIAGSESGSPGLYFAQIDGDTVTTQAIPGTDDRPRVYAVAMSDFHLALGETSKLLSIYTGDYPFDPETEFYVPDVDDLPGTAVGGWEPGRLAKAYVRAK